MKNLLAGLVVGALALAGSVAARDKGDGTTHRVIEVQALKGQDITISVDTDGTTVTKLLNIDQLNDKVYVDAELADLDDSARMLIREALEDVIPILPKGTDLTHVDHTKRKVIVLNSGDGERVHVTGHGEMDFEFNVVQEGVDGMIERQFVIGDEQTVLRGHTPAIVKMIERGGFSQEELDQIQAAVDAKR